MEILVAFIDIRRPVDHRCPKGPLPRLWITSDRGWIEATSDRIAVTISAGSKSSEVRSILVLDDCEQQLPEILRNLECDGKPTAYIVPHTNTAYNDFAAVESALKWSHCEQLTSLRHQLGNMAYSRIFGLLEGTAAAETIWADFMGVARQKVISDMAALCQAVWLFHSKNSRSDINACIRKYQHLWNGLPPSVQDRLIKLDGLHYSSSLQSALQSLIDIASPPTRQ